MFKARTPNRCAYCGAEGIKLEQEHVIPSCLYPESKTQSKVQRITVPSCSACNRGWADDEVQFRNVMLIAGEPNSSIDELWRTTAHRSFYKIDGNRRIQDIIRLMVPVKVEGCDRFEVYPGEKVLRVVRKIVRGLSHFHNIESTISDERVWAGILKYRIPKDLMESVKFHHREPEIIQYWYESYKDLSSVWLLKFFERRTFVAAVSAVASSGSTVTNAMNSSSKSKDSKRAVAVNDCP